MRCVNGFISPSAFRINPLNLSITRVALPDGLQCSLWPTIMQKSHVHIRDGLSMIGNKQTMVISKSTEDADLDLLDSTDIQQLVHMSGWHGQHHTFLSFGDPDFPRGQSLVFEWSIGQFDTCAGFRRHLTDGR